MASIGARSFWVMLGALAKGSRRAASYPHPGIDGRAVCFGAYDAAPQIVETIEAVTGASAASSAWSTYQGMVGTKVAVTDGLGVSWPEVIIIDVQPALVVPGLPGPVRWHAAQISGVSGDHIARAAWRLQLAGTSL